MDIFQIYKRKYEKLVKTEDIVCLLKHFQKISIYLTYDISAKILFKIVLPVFRRNLATGPSLNTIIYFMNDFRNQKEFFVEDNLQTLEELMFNKEFTRLVCEIVKIGIESGVYLGDSLTNQENVNTRLLKILLDSSFYTLNRLKRLKMHNIKWFDQENKFFKSATKANIIENLQIAAINWSFVFDLFKKMEIFRNKFKHMCKIDTDKQTDNGELVLTSLIIILLDCYLNCNPRKREKISENSCYSIKNTCMASTMAMTRLNMKSKENELLLHSTSNESCYAEITKFYVHAEGDSANFLNKLKEQTNCLIFDIKNQESESIEELPKVEFLENYPSVHQENDGTFFGKLLNIFTSLFGYQLHSEEHVQNCERGTEELADIFERREFKKHLLKVIESTLSTLFLHRDSTGEELAMDGFLRKLKKIILNATLDNYECIESSNAVLEVLQTLLKIAEISTKPKCLVIKKHKPETAAINTSTESDVEFFSSKASCSHQESEMEMSENDTEEFYATGDEGYDADCEIHDHEISGGEDDNENIRDLWNPYIPSSRYKTKIIHEGVCKIVIDILIELSQKCAENCAFWIAPLNKLANSLFSIKEYLGGSLFLLKGFSPILQCNKPILAEFQQSILNLVTEFNTPEIFRAYLQILASKNPPVDVLVKFLVYRIFSDIRKESKMELVFPIRKFKCNQLLPSNSFNFEKISKTYNQHKSFEIDQDMPSTAFTRAAGILPLNCDNLFQPQHMQGFTVSLWTQVKCVPCKKDKSQMKMHLFSIGNDRILLSIYLTKNLCLAFETSKPSAEFRTTQIDENGFEAPKSFSKKKKRTISDESKEFLNNQNNSFLNVVQNPTSKSPFKNALKHTKQKILDGFSQIIHSPRDSEDYFEGEFMELKYFRMVKSKWTHMGFIVNVKKDCFEINTIINGSEQHLVKIPCLALNAVIPPSFQVILIGESVNDLEYIEESPCSFSISNLMLFKDVFDKNSIRCLTALGPDCSNLAHCQVGNLKPNFGYINYVHPCGLILQNYSENLCKMNHSMLASFSASKPIQFLQKMSLESDEVYSKMEMISLLTIWSGDLQTTYVKSIQTAVTLSGGLRTLLYLFARVVELTPDPLTQSLALDLLFNIAFSDTHLYTEFIKSEFLALIGCVIQTEQCSKDINLLKIIMNNACNEPIITKKLGSIKVSENTNACIIYPDLIINVISRYTDWHRSTNTSNSEILTILLQCIYVLVRDKHPHKNFNILQLSRFGLVKELLNLCKIHIVEEFKPIFISATSAELFVDILSIFAGSPPSPSILDEIVKLLLLLHKPNKCFILHDRAKMYFLVTADPPTKPKSLISIQTAVQLRWPKRNKNSSKDRKSAVVDSKKSKILRSTDSPLKSYRHFSTTFDTLASIATFNSLKNNKKKFDRYFPNGNVSKLGNFYKSYLKNQKFRCAHSHFQSNRISKEFRRKRFTVLKQVSTAFSSQNSSNFELATNEFDIVHSDELSSNGHIHRNSRSSILKNDMYNCMGIIKLQERLLLLLKDYLQILPDNLTDEVLQHYVKLEILLVLSNNHSPVIRTAILKLITVLCTRLDRNELSTFSKKFYWHHLGNQISTHSIDVSLFETAIQAVSGYYYTINEFAELGCISIQNPYCLNTLIAILPHTTTNSDLAGKAFQIMLNLHSNLNNTTMLIENGIIQSAAKTLYNIYSKNLMSVTFEMEIRRLLVAIGERAIRSVGNINVIWTILNILTFFQASKSENVTRGFRSVQAHLLQHFLNMFVKSTAVSQYKFSQSSFANCQVQLTLTEIRTRFDLLYDHSSQFFITADPAIKPMASEIKLFNLMISIVASDIAKCNNFIIWGLLPIAPKDVQNFIIHMLLIASKQGNLARLSCDGNVLKSFLWNCLVKHNENEIFNKDLQKVCQQLNVKLTDNVWNTGLELEIFQVNRENSLAKQKSAIERTVHLMEPIAQECIESSMIVTRVVAELQNTERKTIINQLKQYNECYSYQEWNNIVQRMTHEGAPWHNEEDYPRSWELSPTEGPSRIHTRLQRTRLDLNSRFFMDDYRHLATSSQQPQQRPLEYLTSNHERQFNFSINSQILYTFPAKFIPIDGEVEGELIITDHKIYFLPTKYCSRFLYNFCDINDISEIWLKRYQHQDIAIEILLDTSRLLFYALKNEEDYKIFKDIFCDKIVQTPDSSKIAPITQQWREGFLTNWEYLMTLNQFSGRTYNDLMQYPVFPWILSNYTSNTLDLHDCDNFRKLEKPIAIQNAENEEHYIDNYNYMESTVTNMGTLNLQPYHFSSHYSNSGTVLHFLVRVPPYSGFFLKYQDNNFDIPDRTFHSLNTTWCLASRDSPTDVKELIPEFFSLPELFVNYEGFDFGLRQSGERVNDVLLPPWCLGDPRLFVLIHRQSLESEIVRNNLHNWIDLIFGYKQTGQNAIDAINVFHPSTYSEFLSSKIQDPIEKKAVETMIKTYGQMPKQLFKSPHYSSKSFDYTKADSPPDLIIPVLPTIKGLRWGLYTGSPQLPEPTLKSAYKFPNISKIMSFQSTNDVYGLSLKCDIMQGSGPDVYNLLCWDKDDNVIRFKSLSITSDKVKTKNLLYDTSFDQITCCGTSFNSSTIWFGHQSGRITVYKCYSDDLYKIQKSRHNYNNRGIKLSYNSAFRKITTSTKSSLIKLGDGELNGSISGSSIGCDYNYCNANSDTNNLTWAEPIVLTGHDNEITCITISDEFKIAVSADKNGVAKIWNLTDITYIRTIPKTSEINPSPIRFVDISPTLGDIVTVHITYQDDDCDSDDSVLNATSDEAFEVTEENLEGFINVAVNPNGKSIMRLHSVNGTYVNHKVLENTVTAICYSYIKEGVGVNVIASGFENGIVSLWSSWNLELIREISIGISGVKSLAFSTYQHLCVLTDDCYLQIWESEGLYGKSPKCHPINFS